ncbi:MAG: DUF1835 domain-containing protein [Acidobacteria bacterium]|nr:DUF1835 domain-containing protein [Acidobacteriota bacterium]MBI3425773.1 DUF1835 domain-containing protein [Acidobacteriota bacterium]
MLHIHNGDSTASTLREAGFPGTHFAFREALATGPTPQGLSKDEWFAVRAKHLAGMAAQEVASIQQELLAQAATLASANQHDEIILWFEHDLFCQIHLIYLLDHFAQHPVAPARLSLICIGAFPGKPNFHGLGELTAEEMASLFDSRHEVNAMELQLAQRVWQAFCSPDPQAIITLLDEDTSALPFLRGALLQHLARFPAVRNGLSHAENTLLALIAAGSTAYMKLCPAFFNAEPAYGLGDTQIQSDLKHMAAAPPPLLQLTGLAEANGWRNVTCDLTAIGQQVRAGQADFVSLNGIDQWLGGVHLTTGHLWRWDEQQTKLV